MRGLRKISKPKGGRRFKGTEDAEHLAEVRKLRCVIAGKRCTVKRWKGVYPNQKEVVEEYVHHCGGGGRVEAHHVVLKSQGGRDADCIPLCPAAHSELHYCGVETFSAKWNVDLKVEAVKLWALLKRESA